MRPLSLVTTYRKGYSFCNGNLSNRWKASGYFHPVAVTSINVNRRFVTAEKRTTMDWERRCFPSNDLCRRGATTSVETFQQQHMARAPNKATMPSYLPLEDANEDSDVFPTDTNSSNNTSNQRHHEQMISLARKILDLDSHNDASFSSSLTRSSLKSDALKVIRYFHMKKYHGLQHNDLTDTAGVMLGKHILEKLLQMDEASKSTTAETNYVSENMFILVIHGLSSAAVTVDPEQPMYYYEQAQDAFKKFQQFILKQNSQGKQQQQQQQLSQQQLLIAFNMVLKVLVNVGTVESAQCAQDRILDMTKLWGRDTSGTIPRPDTVSYNTTLRAWSQALHTTLLGESSNSKNKKTATLCAEKADELLRFMQSIQDTTAKEAPSSQHQRPSLSPTRTSFNIVINAWARTGNVERVESLLKHMEREASDVNKGNNTVDIYPCRYTFKSVIKAYKNSKGDKYKKVAHITAMNMLRIMEDLDEQFYMDVRPDTDVLNDVISCWLSSGEKDAPIQIDALVERMKQLSEAGDFHIQPTALTYKMAIEAWTSTAVVDKEAPTRAEHHLRQMVKLAQENAMNNKNVILSSSDFDTVLSLYSKYQSTEESTQKAMDILTLMQDCCTSGMPWVKPTFHTYKYLLEIWSQSKDPQRGRRCEEFLCLMENMPQVESTRHMTPTTMHYINTIYAILSSSSDSRNQKDDDDDVAWRAEAVLQRMIDIWKGGNPRMRPHFECYTAVAEALNRLQTKEAMSRAKELLHQSVDVELETSKILSELETLSDQGLPLQRLSFLRYNQILLKLSRVPTNLSAESAQQIYFKIDELSRKVAGSEKPDNVMVNTVLNVCSKCEIDGAEKAQAFLDRLEEVQQFDGEALLDRISYSTVIHAWGKSSKLNATDHMLALLSKMEEKWEKNGSIPEKPDFDVYKSIICSMLNTRHKDSIEKAQIAFDKMIAAGISPTPWLLKRMIQAWCSVGATDKAELILYLSLERDSAEDSIEQHPQALEPIIKSHLRSRRPDSVERAEKVLLQMLLFSDVGKSSAAPSNIDMTMVLNAYSTRNTVSHAKRAVALLSHAVEQQKRGTLGFAPGKEMFDSVLLSLATSKFNDDNEQVDIGEKAELILELMKNPDQYSYSLAISAWARSKNQHSGERAQLLFDKMCQSVEFRPDPDVYQSLIHAWANGSSEKKAEKAQLVLSDLMSTRYGSLNDIKPTVHHFNSVLNACLWMTSSGNSYTALKVAMSVFRELNALLYVEPDEYTYRMMFQVCRKYMFDEAKRDQLTEKLFREICRNGGLTQGVVDNFRATASPSLRRKYLGDFQKDSSTVTVSDLPFDWQSKAKRKEDVAT